MAGKRMLGMSVFDAAIDRMVALYEKGHRIVVSFSGGKDSGVTLEICVIAATMTGRLPVEVIMRDEEIMYPGTFEYAERVASRPEISFNWIYANQPVINVFNRREPYFWVFDPFLPPEQWVRRPPEFAYKIDQQHIEGMTIPERFPPAEGKRLYAVIGLRVQESRARLMGLYSSKSYITKPNSFGVSNVRPAFDWKDGDVWKAIKDNHWDYNEAYDVMYRLGVSRSRLRIAPPTLNYHGAETMKLAAKAWPRWFDSVCDRLEGARLAAKYGARAVTPQRRFGETWEQCFIRTCITTAPDWIAVRSEKLMEHKLGFHSRHSVEPFPESRSCALCDGKIRSWRSMAHGMYNGDPFGTHDDKNIAVEPEFFRQGAGVWSGGKPTW